MVASLMRISVSDLGGPLSGGRRWDDAGMPVTLRSATLADIDTVLALWESAAENRDRPADSRQAVETLVARDPDALILAIGNDEIIGSIVAGWDGWRCHLYRLAVHPDQRRLGVGQLLINAAEGRGRALGAGRIDAMVLDGNELGAAIWERNGYVRQTEWSRWVKPVSPRSSR
jgi:ribosomal protein S18 acetylase RimI-like enzyme